MVLNKVCGLDKKNMSIRTMSTKYHFREDIKKTGGSHEILKARE